MHFVNDNWGLVWAVAVALLGSVPPVIFLQARRNSEEGTRGYERYRPPTLLHRFMALALAPLLHLIWGAGLLFLLLLPLTTTFPSWIPHSRDREESREDQVRAGVAEADAVRRLAESQRALVDEMRRRGPCTDCRERIVVKVRDDRVSGFPFSPWGLGGLAFLFIGLWLAFDGKWLGRRPRDWRWDPEKSDAP